MLRIGTFVYKKKNCHCLVSNDQSNVNFCMFSKFDCFSLDKKTPKMTSTRFQSRKLELERLKNEKIAALEKELA